MQAVPRQSFPGHRHILGIDSGLRPSTPQAAVLFFRKVEGTALPDRGQRLENPLSRSKPMTQFGGSGQLSTWPCLRFDKMPTAILLERTGEGFFIAADGRSMRDEETIHLDNEQKIFPIIHGPARFAFATTATVRFTADDNEQDFVYQLNVEIPKLAAALAKEKRIRDGAEYGVRLAASVRKYLKFSVTEAMRLGKVQGYPSNRDQFGDDMIAWLFLCGYYSRVPYQATFRFFHRDQNLAGAEIVGRLGVGESFIYGSDRIADFLYRSGDPRFARFRATGLTPIQQAQNYVAACESVEGLSVDPEGCRKIGGRVHGATVTAADGFRWIPGFEPRAKGERDC
jgi:hypothetical protein